MANPRKKSKQTARGKLAAMAPLALAVLALVAISWNFLSSGWHHSVQSEWDWDFYFWSREVVRRIWMAGGSLFPWVASTCGGFPLLDSTEIPYLSPFVVVWQLIGPVPGAKLEFVILLAIGMIGMYRLGREIAPLGSRWVHALAGLQFVCAGFFVLHLNAGHISFAPYALFPWIVFGFFSGQVAPIALSLAAGPLLGSNNYFMHAVLFTLAMGLSRPREWLPLCVKGGIWSGLLSAPILAHTLLEYKSASYLNFSAAQHHELPQTVASLVTLMTSDRRDFWFCDVDCFWEYGNYIGAIAFMLGLSGLMKGALADRRLRSLGAVGLVFFLISMGPFAEWAPFRLFVHLPLLSRLEVNTRFLLGFTVVLMAGWIRLLGVELGGKRSALALVLAIASVAPALSYAKYFYDFPGRGRELPDLRSRGANVTMLTTPGDFRTSRYDAIATETGITTCHVSSSKQSYPGKVVRDRPGMLLEAPARSQARYDGLYWWIDWSPSAEDLGGGGKRSWLLNQNFSAHQRALLVGSPEVGVETSARDDLLMVSIADVSALSPGEYHLRIFLDPGAGLVVAYLIFIAAWIAFLMLFLRDLRGGKTWQKSRLRRALR